MIEPHTAPTIISIFAGSVLFVGFVSPGFFTVAIFEYSQARIVFDA
jgi:hypothetical protein